MTTGTAIYDLSRSPPTFNFVDFLLSAEVWRIQEKLDRLRVRILHGPEGGFRRDKLPPFGIEERRKWLANIVLPMPTLLPSCGEAAVFYGDYASEAPEFGRGKYCIGFERNVIAAKANVYPFRAPQETVASYVRRYGKYVTITLRETPWWPDRNSDLVQWLKVAAAVKERGYLPVFVRDGTKADDKIDGDETVPAASFNSAERGAVYAGAALNLGVNNGPMWLSWFMGAPTIICKIVNANEPASSAQHFIGYGLPPGTQMPNARPGQKLIWQTDSADILIPEIDAILR